MMNIGMDYAEADMGSGRELRVEDIGLVNEMGSSRGGNMQREHSFEGRQEYGNRREVEELESQSYRREENQDDHRRTRKRVSKSRRRKSDLGEESSYSRRARREGNDIRDRFCEASSSNSQVGDHFEQRTPHRDYSH